MNMFMDYFLYFIIYSFLGYICEVIYVSIGTRHLTNRGYLYGPICPIYGCGAVIILLSLSYFIDIWPLVFILGFILTTTLEYIVSYLMELIFHMRWWDYSKRKLNINGRVCILNSTLFALLVMALMYLIHPYLVKPLIALIPSVEIKTVIFSILLVILIIDTIISTIKNMDKAKLVLKLQNNILNHEYKRAQARIDFDLRLLAKLKKINRTYPSLRVINRHRKAKEDLRELINRLENIFKGE